MIEFISLSKVVKPDTAVINIKYNGKYEAIRLTDCGGDVKDIGSKADAEFTKGLYDLMHGSMNDTLTNPEDVYDADDISTLITNTLYLLNDVKYRENELN